MTLNTTWINRRYRKASQITGFKYKQQRWCWLACRIVWRELRLNQFHQSTKFWMLRKILSKSPICCKIWLGWPKNEVCLIKFLPISLLRVKKHFSHKGILFFTKKLLKILSSWRSSASSSSLFYTKHKSTFKPGRVQCWAFSAAPGQWQNGERRPRSSLGNTGGAAGARSLELWHSESGNTRLEWAWP